MVVSFHHCNETAEMTNLKGEKAYFGSWLWRFQSRIALPLLPWARGVWYGSSWGGCLTMETCSTHGNGDKNRGRGRGWGPNRPPTPI